MWFPTMDNDGIRRPIIPIILESLAGKRLIVDALVDTGSDITLFPEAFAPALGIDLAEATPQRLNSALGVAAYYRSADVLLELRRGRSDRFRWRTRVGFLSRPMVYSILGSKGFFEFFVMRYDVLGEEITIEPNREYNKRDEA